MEDHKAVIAERVRELAASYCIRVKDVLVGNSVNREMELTVFLDLGGVERPHKIRIPIVDVEDYQSGSDVRMRVDREIESVLRAISSQ